MIRKLTKELLMIAPNMAILTGRLALDKRVPKESKVALAAAAVYFVSPIDIIPDFIPVLGQLDDLIAVMLVIDGVLNHLDPQIVRECWRGDPRTLAKMQSITAAVTGFVPRRFKDKFFHRRFLRRKPVETEARVLGNEHRVVKR